MKLETSFNKYYNIFTEQTPYIEYLELFGDFPESDIRDIFLDINKECNIITAKLFFITLNNTIIQYIDKNDYSNNLISVLINNLSNINTHKSSTILQTYFNEIKDIYSSLEKCGQLEHEEYNRQTILSQSLKMVIHIAKRYQGLGVDMEDLISAGNVGLCVAWDKFKPNNNSKRDKFLELIEDCPDELSKDYIQYILIDALKYGNIKDSFEKTFKDERVYKKTEVTSWIYNNIKSAKFSSVANMWIRAYIMQELNNNSRIVKKPKSEIDKDRLKYNGAHIRENISRFDEVETDENFKNLLNIKEMQTTDNDICNENEFIMLTTINKLMVDVPQRDRDIIYKIYGIGYPKPLPLKEISSEIGITIARISQIIINTIEKMKNNSTPEDKALLLSILNNEE